MSNKKVQVSAICGSFLEFYDFVVYSFFVNYISANFFPYASPIGSLLDTLAVFATGFAARPVGAVLLGRYADRHGRRPAIVFAMALMTTSTIAIAVLPTYAQIGMLAPLLLVMCRLLQGFALGGEIGPAAAYLLETAPVGRAGRTCSWLFASQGAAIFFAGVVGAAATSTLSSLQMMEWGWRIPFCVSAFLAPCTFFIRQGISEEFFWKRELEHKDAADLEDQTNGSAVVLLTIALIGGTAANYMCSYLGTFATTTLSLPPSVALSTTIIVGLGTFLGALTGGWLSDRFGERPVLLRSRLACTLLALPAFEILTCCPTVTCLWTTAAVLSVVNGINGGAIFSTIAKAFSRRNRAAGFSIVYACGVAVFGGSSQFLVASLIEFTGLRIMPGLYMFITGVIAYAALFATLRNPVKLS